MRAKHGSEVGRPARRLATACGIVAVALGWGAGIADALTFNPPGWWQNGKALVEARGGTCSTSHSDLPTSYVPGEGGTYSEDKVACLADVPRAVALEFGSNPNSPVGYQEGCVGGYTTGKPGGDGDSYFCVIYEDPGTDSSPNRASWPCQRFYDSTTPADERVPQRENNWNGKATRFFPQRFSPTLTGCLAPRVALEDRTESLARTRLHGLGVPLRCSTACRVRISALHVPTVTAEVTRGERKVLRVRLPRAAVRVALALTVSADGFRKTGRLTVQVRANRVKLRSPDTLSLAKP